MNSNVKQKHRVTNGVYSRRHCFKWLSDARNLSRFATWQAPLNLFIQPRSRAGLQTQENSQKSPGLPCPPNHSPYHLPLLPPCSTGENETANEYWKRARDCKWCIVDCGNILREKEQNENIRTLEILFIDEYRSRGERNASERRMQNCLLLLGILVMSGFVRRAIIDCN